MSEPCSRLLLIGLQSPSLTLFIKNQSRAGPLPHGMNSDQQKRQKIER